jgi:hypothetical protein
MFERYPEFYPSCGRFEWFSDVIEQVHKKGKKREFKEALVIKIKDAKRIIEDMQKLIDKYIPK